MRIQAHNYAHRLRLKQQYFWVAASLNDIIRRFQKLQLPWSEVRLLLLTVDWTVKRSLAQFPQYNGEPAHLSYR